MNNFPFDILKLNAIICMRKYCSRHVKRYLDKYPNLSIARSDIYGYTVLVIIKLTKVAKFKNVVHSLEPGETPNNSASHQASNYVQRS